MQQLPQSPVVSGIVRGIHSLVILAEELGALLLGQVPQNDLGVVWILDMDRLSGHAASLRPVGPSPPQMWVPAHGGPARARARLVQVTNHRGAP